MAKKLLEFLELRRRDDLEDHRISLAKDHKLISFIEPKVFANLLGNDYLSLRRQLRCGISGHDLGSILPVRLTQFAKAIKTVVAGSNPHNVWTRSDRIPGARP